MKVLWVASDPAGIVKMIGFVFGSFIFRTLSEEKPQQAGTLSEENHMSTRASSSLFNENVVDGPTNVELLVVAYQFIHSLNS